MGKQNTYSILQPEATQKPIRALSTRERISGAVVLLGSLPLSVRLIWEMTLLTWRKGPQMIGFSMMHLMPELFLIGSLFTLGAISWMLVIGSLAVSRRRHLAGPDWVLFAATTVTVIGPFVPYSAWQWITNILLGAPR